MGIGGISIWQLVIILVIVLLLFGTKRLRNLGGDLGSAIKGFKKAVKDEDKKESQDEQKSLTEETETKAEDSNVTSNSKDEIK